jgi:hypothetical protein
MSSYTHKQLVRRAGIWLRNSIGCKVVMEELTSYTANGEIPDAIGWKNNQCIVIECKTSRSDFFADKKKIFRQFSDLGMGHWRFFLTPPNMISNNEIPQGWGLYEVHTNSTRYKGGIKFTNTSIAPFSSNRDSEVQMLLSSIRRLQISRAVYIVSSENEMEDL